jgi:hypothetical protein
MSFGNLKVFNGVEQALILALMLVTMLTLFYVDISFTYKVGIAAFSFIVIFLATLANAILRQQRELRKQQTRQA